MPLAIRSLDRRISRSLYSRPCTVAPWWQSGRISSGFLTTEREAAALEASILTPAQVTTRPDLLTFCGEAWCVLNDHFEISSLIAPEQENARA